MTGGVHHLGYVVDDLRAAIPRAIVTLQTGPFFLIEHLAFDETTFRGGPAEYDHSSAFAACEGGLLVELTQVHSAAPPELEDMLGGRTGLGHVAWLADDLAAETARLTAAGIEPFHTGRTGPASAVWFDATASLGHHIEVLQSAPPLLSFYDSIRAARATWDGTTDPIRPVG
ncbi:MAG TPA: VOC family protein [Baekduia sp.]|nr:VOC family protein [Baekduia sp.]